MERKNFLKNLALGVAGLSATKAVGMPKAHQSTYDKLMDQVGFNHLPNKKDNNMNTVLHRAETRGNANHGWLNTKHTFSFANYYNPAKDEFWCLEGSK